MKQILLLVMSLVTSHVGVAWLPKTVHQTRVPTVQQQSRLLVTTSNNSASESTSNYQSTSIDSDYARKNRFDDELTNSTKYTTPMFSESFLKHRADVVSSWPSGGDIEDGVQCTGEPAVDPSRELQGDEGDSEWMIN